MKVFFWAAYSYRLQNPCNFHPSWGVGSTLKKGMQCKIFLCASAETTKPPAHGKVTRFLNLSTPFYICGGSVSSPSTKWLQDLTLRTRSLVPRPSHPTLVLQVTNPGVIRPGYEARHSQCTPKTSTGMPCTCNIDQMTLHSDGRLLIFCTCSESYANPCNHPCSLKDILLHLGMHTHSVD